jgi:COMPASS component SWD3
MKPFLIIFFCLSFFNTTAAAQSPIRSFMTNRGKIYDFEIDPGGKWIIMAHEYESLSLWGLESGAQREEYLGFGGSVRSICLNHNATQVFAGGGDSAVFTFGSSDLKRVSRRTGHRNWVYDLAAHPTQNLVFSAGPDTLILIWDAVASKPIDSLKGHKHWIWKLRFAPNPTFLYAAAGETELVRWNLEKGKIDLRFHGHNAGIFDVDVHPDGSLLASASWDGTVRIWNAVTGNEVQLLTPRQPMQSVLWSPDGKYLVLGDYLGTIYVYHVKDWKKNKQFQAHAGAIRKMGFMNSADGKSQLLSAGDDGRLKFWDFSAWIQ